MQYQRLETMMRALDLETLYLERGKHDPDSKMCIMEAVAYVAGEPWSDSPSCASPVISAFLRSYNDSVSDEIRQTLKPYIPRLIGSAASPAIEERRALMVTDWLVRIHAPARLRLAGLTSNAEALESLPEITSMAQIPSIKGPFVKMIEDARKDATTAEVAAWAGSWAAAGDAAWDAAGDAARVAVGDAAGSAAWVAAWVAAWDAARGADGDADGDAAGDALKLTVEKLQSLVPALIDRMLEIN